MGSVCKVIQNSIVYCVLTLYNAEEAAEETQTFPTMYQPIPSVEYKITKEESILHQVGGGEDSEEEFLHEEAEHEVSDSYDSEEKFVNEEEVQKDGLFFVYRGQNRSIVNKITYL